MARRDTHLVADNGHIITKLKVSVPFNLDHLTIPHTWDNVAILNPQVAAGVTLKERSWGMNGKLPILAFLASLTAGTLILVFTAPITLENRYTTQVFTFITALLIGIFSGRFAWLSGILFLLGPTLFLSLLGFIALFVSPPSGQFGVFGLVLVAMPFYRVILIPLVLGITTAIVTTSMFEKFLSRYK